MAKKNGIRQVAAEAKVSIGTVSKILNPDSACNIQVSPETRERVLAVAKKLAYQPSYSAKLLRGEASRTIGFALSQPMDTAGPICPITTPPSSTGWGAPPERTVIRCCSLTASITGILWTLSGWTRWWSPITIYRTTRTRTP